jgi:hypothetical protein
VTKQSENVVLSNRHPTPAFGTSTRFARRLTLAAASVVAWTASPSAQELASGDSIPTREHAPLLYIDCNRCDFSHIRREITFVNHVRDPNVAEIHALITDQTTGSGGRTFRLYFTGRQQFSSIDHTLTYTSGATQTSAEQRDGLTETLKLGLAPYVIRTPLSGQLRLSFRETPGARAAAENGHDPWNNWTFEIYGGGNFSTESTQDAFNARYGFYADRVTDDWKIRLRPYFNNNIRVYRTADDEIRTSQRRHGFESYLIRSVGPHVGVGFFGEYITTTFDNLRHRFTLTPAVEYSLFPYAESNRREITVAYRLGYELADYFEETIYERTEENLLNHAVNAAVRFRQPWGSISSRLTASNYLHDMDHYRLTFNGSTSVRVVQGFNVSFGGNFQRIHDQLSLPRGDASLEDILLQRRRLATSYRAWGEVGLTYTFGSIYNNVVNPRL